VTHPDDWFDDDLPEDVVLHYGSVPITDELMADMQAFHPAAGPTAALIDQLLLERLHRWLEPWEYPDPNPMPALVLFPRLERLHARWRHMRQHQGQQEEGEW
jgi:hypothetical protein